LRGAQRPKQSSFPSRGAKAGLLRFARNDGVDGPDGISVPDW
jgi:hypothetical protein